jgi:uncharacterized repeat protein (TIGR01451 family)/LPXTG-motif cell wall-anchored protein
MKNFSPNNKIYGLAKILMVVVTIVSTVGFWPFSVAFSNTSTAAIPVAQACEEQKVCNLTLTKTDSVDPVEPGDELVYHLTLKNIGNGDCTGTGVLIKDVFDPNTTYVGSSKTPAETTSEYIKWNFGTVTPGEIENVDLTMLVSQEAQCGSVLINKAKSWSTQTNWSEFVIQETSVVCPPEPFCGDGNLDQGEECEVGHECECGDGFTCDTQTCLCEQLPPEPYCGDGTKNQLTEQCDGTDWVGEHQSCTQDCQLIDLPWCGDGIKNDAEECDGTDGLGEHQACTAQCTIVNLDWCGDGVKNGDEQCDGTDGVSEHYTCTDTCTLEYVPYCGDNIVQGSEQCDDGNIIDGDGCTANCTIEQPVCDGTKNLIINGGFESPLIADSQSWNIYSNSQISGWKIEWVSLTPSEFGGFARPINANLELQNSNVGWDPQEGNQFAELDSDWDGPSGSLNGEPASVKIYQDIPTIAGATYNIAFWFSPRPGTGLTDNRLQFKWDSEVKDTLEAAGENNTAWIKHEYTFTASGTVTRLYFTDLGYANSLGTFLDNVSVKCVPPQEPICGDNIKNQISEECDGTDGIAEHYSCTSQCTLQYIPYCGDNITNQTSEQCDDGNAVNGDGCSSTCQLEQNEPSCGNGVIEAGEACDNGLQNGVGCNPACGNTCSYCTVQCMITTNTGGTCGGGGGGGGGDNPFPALAIMKSVAESSVNPGGTINYTVKVKNNAFATAINVTLKDTLPVGFTFKDTGLAEKEWSLGDIAYGVEKITTFQVVVGTGVGIGDYKNTAMAKADNQGAIYANALIPVIIGQVLGARTELPNTGMDPFWFVFAGLSLILVSLIGIYLTDANSKRIIKLINN